MRKAAAAVLVIVLLAAAGFFGLWTAGKKEADADTEPEKTVIYFSIIIPVNPATRVKNSGSWSGIRLRKSKTTFPTG